MLQLLHSGVGAVGRAESLRGCGGSLASEASDEGLVSESNGEF